MLVSSIGRVGLTFEIRSRRGNLVSGVIRFSQPASGLSVLEKEIVAFERHDEYLRLVLPSDWFKQGTDEHIRCVVAEIAIQLAQTLRREGVYMNPAGMELHIDSF